MIFNNYCVHHKRGRMFVSVPRDLIEKRGERTIVAKRAWQQLLGKNILDEDVKKNLITRQILMDEMLSHYRNERSKIYVQFETTIKITLMGISHGKD